MGLKNNVVAIAFRKIYLKIVNMLNTKAMIVLVRKKGLEQTWWWQNEA